jgi:hypothetical protein
VTHVMPAAFQANAMMTELIGIDEKHVWRNAIVKFGHWTRASMRAVRIHTQVPSRTNADSHVTVL